MSDIPLTLVQTGRPGLEQCPSAQLWREHQKDLAYRYFDDETCRIFLAQHLGERVARAFDGIRPGAFKADLFRYAFLYVKGGIYVDLDMSPAVPLSTILAAHPEAQLIACTERPGIRGVWQGFLASAPGLAPLKWAIDKIVFHVESQHYPPEQERQGRNFWEPVLSLTGPVLLASALARCGDDPSYRFLQGGDQMVGDLPVHLLPFDGSVKDHHGNLLIAEDNTDYSTHDNYSEMFMERRVYC